MVNMGFASSIKAMLLWRRQSNFNLAKKRDFCEVKLCSKGREQGVGWGGVVSHY